MDSIETIIRDLAHMHGHEKLADSEVEEVKRILAHDYIDGLLDAPAEQREKNTDDGEDHGKA